MDDEKNVFGSAAAYILLHNKAQEVLNMKKIGIGYENYMEFVEQDLYYIDKTMLIRDVVEDGAKVLLFTRPRRFGKTLALSMLRTFFELEYDFDGKVIDKRQYFEGKKIMDCGEQVLSKMGQYPVIKLSLKSAKQPNFKNAVLQLRDEILYEFYRHSYLKGSENLTPELLQKFKALSKPAQWEALREEDAFQEEIGRYATALKTLSSCLQKHHGKKVIILLDEYDVPLENAYYSGFYPEMIAFIRSLFESALKTNDALELAVVTGCLRIARESIFTGLNHLKIVSVRAGQFTEGFGFTQGETERMLCDYGLEEKTEEVRDWYDGYLFGEAEIYNPWSVINYVYDHKDSHKRFPEPYWSNTSSNEIIRDLVYQSDDETKAELDLLIRGGSIEKKIHEDITYDEIHKSRENLWNFLFFTGYLRTVSERMEGEDIYATMRIPNREIRSVYRNQISGWFEDVVRKEDRSVLHQAVLDQDTDVIASFVTNILKKTISTFDSAESFYHGFFIPLLYGIKDYEVRSNREEGNGRPDVILYPENPTDPAYIFEIKVRKKFNQMQDGIEEAFQQIRDRKYEEGILDDGYAGVISFGICFCKKSCIVKRMEL